MTDDTIRLLVDGMDSRERFLLLWMSPYPYGIYDRLSGVTLDDLIGKRLVEVVGNQARVTELGHQVVQQILRDRHGEKTEQKSDASGDAGSDAAA